MKKKVTLLYLLFALIFSLSCFEAWAQLYVNAFNGAATCPTQGNVPILAANAAGTPLTRNTVTCTPLANNVFVSTTLNNTAAIINTSYITFSVAANAGYQLNLTSLSFDRRGSNDAPNKIEVRYSTDGFATSTTWGAAPLTTTTISLATWDFPDFSTAVGGTVTFRIYVYGTQRCDLTAPAAVAASAFLLDNVTINGTVSLPSKYYRSVTSGDWMSAATWSTSTDNITFSPSVTTPTSSDYSITIEPGNTVTVSTPVSLDETTIMGTLQVQTGGVLNINDGTGNDIDIQNNGVLQVLTTDPYNLSVIPGTSAINVETGGRITIGDGTVAVGTGYEKFATSADNTWNDASVLEWNTPTKFLFRGNIYFPLAAVGVIPNFIVNKVTGPIGGPGAATLNGLLTVNSDFTFDGNGLKTFRDGISGTAQLTLDVSTGGYTISSPNAIIAGTVSIILNEDLRVTSGVTIPVGSSVNIAGSSLDNIAKAGGVFLVNGTVNMNSTNITNTTGSVTVNGTLKTASIAGLYGTAVATVTSGLIVLNNNSTIEYNAAGDQLVQGITVPNYYNVIFSGSGIKTLQSANTPAGTITVAGAAIFNAHNFTFGGAGTNLTMTGTSQYINGGAATKPDAQGTYNLGINTTIEFANNSVTTIRLGLSPISYANMVVSGSNVSNASMTTGILFQNGGSFTVKTNATFKLNNTAGFSGNGSAAISNVNNPSITLENGSTVGYIGFNQTLTNQIPYQNLSIAGTGIATAPSGILTVQGNLAKQGTSTFAHNGGTVVLNGAAQTFAGLTYNNLILTGNTKTTAGASTIIDSIKINDGTTLSISAADTITLHSDAVKTARMGQLGTGVIGYNSTGKFQVERYIPARKAWIFLAVPTSSAQTIKQAWQEGALNSSSDPNPGYGIQVTSDRASWSGDGFDLFSVGGPSMKIYNSAGNNYSGISSTLNPFDASTGGYMAFIRGNRVSNSVASPVTATVLRTAGTLFTGSQPVIPVISGNIIPVNNPYASPLDLRQISRSYNVFYYVWDPNRGGTNGFGAFQTFSWNGTDYDVVPGNSGSYGATNNYIASGQAFFVSTLGADTSIQLTENAKTAATVAIIPFTPVGVPSGRLRANLYSLNTDGSLLLADGVLCSFGDDYRNGLNVTGAAKHHNPGENLSIKNNNALLAIERRRYPQANDTIFLNFTGASRLPYRLEIIYGALAQTNTEAFLEDTYLHTRVSITPDDTTKVNFAVTGDAASSAPNRFRVVFEAAKEPLHVTFTRADAYLKNENIVVEWNTENETAIEHYEVEKSPDGTHFTPAVMVTSNNIPGGSNYSWLDVQPVAGYNYYRIKSLDINGAISYSNLLTVFAGNMKDGITVFPNPAGRGIIHLLFTNQPGGKYGIRLINKSGQLITEKEIQHADNSSSTESISIDAYTAHGVYRLEVIKPGGNKVNINVVY